MNEIKCPKCGNVFSVDEADYASIVNQVRNKEFQDEVSRRVAEKEKQYLVKLELELNKKEAEIDRLKEAVNGISNAKELEFKQVLEKKEQEISRLNIAVARNDSQRKVALLEAENRFKDELQAKNNEIIELKGKISSEKDAATIREKSLTDKFNLQLREKQELIDYYKDLKTRMSTK